MVFPISKNFKPDYSPELFVISLSVEKPPIPKQITLAAQDNNFLPKEESNLHISIVVTDHAKKLQATVSQHDNPKQITEDIHNLFKDLAWEYTLTDEYFLHERVYGEQDLVTSGADDVTPHTRRTIVQKVILPDLMLFYEKLNNLLQLSLTVPVPHITLFSWSDHEPWMLRGIGICSEEDFRSYTKEQL